MLDTKTSTACMGIRIEQTLHGIEKEAYLLQVLRDTGYLQPVDLETVKAVEESLNDFSFAVDELLDNL